MQTTASGRAPHGKRQPGRGSLAWPLQLLPRGQRLGLALGLALNHVQRTLWTLRCSLRLPSSSGSLLFPLLTCFPRKPAPSLASLRPASSQGLALAASLPLLVAHAVGVRSGGNGGATAALPSSLDVRTQGPARHRLGALLTLLQHVPICSARAPCPGQVHGARAVYVHRCVACHRGAQAPGQVRRRCHCCVVVLQTVGRTCL